MEDWILCIYISACNIQIITKRIALFMFNFSVVLTYIIQYYCNYLIRLLAFQCAIFMLNETKCNFVYIPVAITFLKVIVYPANCIYFWKTLLQETAKIKGSNLTLYFVLLYLNLPNLASQIQIKYLFHINIFYKKYIKPWFFYSVFSETDALSHCLPPKK